MDETEEVQREVPLYRLHHSEMKKGVLEDAIIEVSKAVNEHQLDKDAAMAIVERLKAIPAFAEMGQGEWQCFIGRNLAASLTYDTSVIAFFDLFKPKRKTVLLFKG